MKLYEVTNQIISAQHDEVNTDQLDALASSQVSIKHSFMILVESKAIGCACVVKNLNAEVSAIDAEIKRLTSLKATRQNNIDRLKAYLLACMKQASINKVENGIHKIRVAKSPHTVQVLDETRIPAEFRKVIIERTEKRILDHLKETGEIVDGIEIVQNEHLRIS